jgi:hypothetical protein
MSHITCNLGHPILAIVCNLGPSYWCNLGLPLPLVSNVPRLSLLVQAWDSDSEPTSESRTDSHLNITQQ